VADHIYERDGELFVPTQWAGGPWSAETQHGAPVAGLFARAAEEAASECELQLARLTIDLFRPVPRVPLRLVRRIVRRGRKLALIEVALLRGDEEISRASALLLAARPELASAWAQPAAPLPTALEYAKPFSFMPSEFRDRVPPGFHFSIESRMARDEFGHVVWLTTPLELVAGEATSPSVRFGALSDLTFAMGGRLALRSGAIDANSVQTSFINADITLYRERTPAGEWLAFRPVAVTDHAGIGIAEVAQFDHTGRIGRSLQALVANQFG
jgi:acyl-CoA thioesterase